MSIPIIKESLTLSGGVPYYILPIFVFIIFPPFGKFINILLSCLLYVF